jgi:hypothetical protein
MGFLFDMPSFHLREKLKTPGRASLRIHAARVTQGFLTLLVLGAMPGLVSCYEGTRFVESQDMGEDDEGQTVLPEPDAIEPAMDLEPEHTGEDAEEVGEEPAEDYTDDAGADIEWDIPCPYGMAGCMDGCCPDCENGEGMEIGGCWSTCEEYYSIEMDCSVICPDFTCDAMYTSDWLPPGCAGRRDAGFCMGAFGKNSFWYDAPLTVHVAIGGDPEPPCPLDDPCCHPRACEFGFVVGTDCGGYGFVPLDLSEVPDIGWSCSATNCGAVSTPLEGTRVMVHVRWHPNHIDPPERFILEELCEIL